MPNYCKKCGYVFGLGYVPWLVGKGRCPICISKLFETKETISYFEGRTEKSMPTWEDVVRHRYLKDVKLDEKLSNKRAKKEMKKREFELNSFRNTRQEETVTIPNIPTPKCPTCQSTNIQRISTTSKMFDIMLVGHFSRAARSQFKCNSCGYMW